MCVCFFVPLNMDVLSSTSQNAWQEWDAEHTPRERAKCRSRLGAAHIWSESGAPAEARRTARSGTSHPNLQTIQNLPGPSQHGRPVVHVAKCVAGMGRSAHPARKGEMSLSPWRRAHFVLKVALPLRRGAQLLLANSSGRPILTCKKQCEVDVVPINMDVLSSTSQNAWQEWDAARTPARNCEMSLSPWRRAQFF